MTCLLVVGLALAACGRSSPVASTPDDGSAGAEAPGLTTFPLGERRAAPRVQGELLDGGLFESDGYQGQVLVYNVWGSWCAPCRAEAPVLRQVAGETRDQDVQFVGIDTRDNRKAARAFERRYGIRYPSVFDSDGRVLLAFRGIVPVAAVPTTVVVDRQGQVAARIIGRARLADLRKAVKAGAGAPTPGAADPVGDLRR
jgi:thiol-disulfide isomerase/thioredoxin